MDKIKRHEFTDATGKPGGPADFLGSLSMPLMGLRAILTGRPCWISCENLCSSPYKTA